MGSCSDIDDSNEQEGGGQTKEHGHYHTDGDSNSDDLALRYRGYIMNIVSHVHDTTIDVSAYLAAQRSLARASVRPPFDLLKINRASFICLRQVANLSTLAHLKEGEEHTSRGIDSFPPIMHEFQILGMLSNFVGQSCVYIYAAVTSLQAGNDLWPSWALSLPHYERAETQLSLANHALGIAVSLMPDIEQQQEQTGEDEDPSKDNSEDPGSETTQAKYDKVIVSLWGKADAQFDDLADFFDDAIACSDDGDLDCAIAAMSAAGFTCDSASRYIGEIVQLSEGSDWSHVQFHVSNYCDGLFAVVDHLATNRVDLAGPALDDALASLALAQPYIERLIDSK